jgi:UDP-N-acetylmuramoyl-L-alanyl-D-glutamate--2,6-diaminopimelate ligase
MKLMELMIEDAVFDSRFSHLNIAGLAADSRKVKPGDLFVAVPGTKADGVRFVADAVRAGAAAIVAEKAPEVPLPDGIALARVADARRVLALLAAKFFPRQPSTIAAVTGTSGKTSVAAFARQIYASLGRRAASIGTLGVVAPEFEIYGSLTTPDPIELHRTLDRLFEVGVTHAVLEASSHGLDQRRLDGVRVSVGAFTNLSRDHLDYHPSLEAYLGAKLRLFETLIQTGGSAVINVDTPYANAVLSAAKARHLQVFAVGRGGGDLRLTATAMEADAQRLQIEYRGRSFSVALPLVGDFQIENALVAAGIVIASGVQAARVVPALETLRGAKGRLELVARKNEALIFVDYAHKPDALAKALEALRPYATGRLVVVFGAGGDRDAGKRPMMGAIAANKADRVIITDDNPRTEDPAAIRAAILAAAPGALELPDRADAISYAISALAAGDVLLIAGKGHESGQIIGDRVLPFTDHEAVATALKERIE